MRETRVGGEVFQKKQNNTLKNYGKTTTTKNNNKEAEDSQNSLAVSGPKRSVKECAMFDLSLFCFSFCLSRWMMTMSITVTVIFDDRAGEKKIAMLPI